MGERGTTTNLSAPPVMLNVFPDPVCPYANTVLFSEIGACSVRSRSNIKNITISTRLSHEHLLVYVAFGYDQVTIKTRQRQEKVDQE